MNTQLNFNRYKRFFAIGCSFTRYWWPTWADLMAKEMPEAEYYNLAEPGAGSIYIVSRLAEAHSKFNFCETDLVGIMWSTFTREDRWVHGKWLTSANIYKDCKPCYPPGWLKRCADPLGYLIRDLGFMTLSNGFLKSLNCTSVEFFAQSVADYLLYDQKYLIDSEINKVLTVYKDTIERTNKYSLLTHMTDENGNMKLWGNHDKSFGDSHPSPLMAYDYLIKLNIPLTDISKQHATETEQAMSGERVNIRALSLGTDRYIDLL